MAGRMGAPLILLLLSTSWAGCLDGLPFLGDDDKADASVARVVEARLDGSAMEALADAQGPEEVVERLLSASFEYMHAGSTVSAASVTVAYRDASGKDVQEGLKEHTRRADVRAGDLVTIDGVHPLSGIEVRQGDQVLAARLPVEADWLTARGMPLPLAAADGAHAAWTFETEAAVGFRMDGFTIDDEIEGSGRLDRASMTFTQKASGELAMGMAGGKLRFDTGLDAEGTVDLDVAGTVDEGEGPAEVRAELEGRGTGSADAEVVLGFDDRGRLKEAGAGGSATFDATWKGTFVEDGETEEISSDGMDHPILDESFPFRSEPIPGAMDVPVSMVRVLQDLWGLDLAVGDRFVVDLSAPAGGSVPVDFGYRLQVAGRDERTVDEEKRSTLRIVQSMDFGDLDFLPVDRIETTYWIDEESRLPVFAQGEYDMRFDEEDIADLFAELPEMPEVEVPAGSEFTLRSSFTMRLTEYDEGFTMPAILSMQGLQAATVLGAAATFVAVSDLGGEDPWGVEESAPDLTWMRGEAEDRLTVVRAKAGADWSRLAFSSDGMLLGAVNARAEEGSAVMWSTLSDGPVQAGDTVDFCGRFGTVEEIDVRIADEPTGALLFEATFASIRACE